MKKAILILLGIIATKASMAAPSSYLRPQQAVAGYKSLEVNSDGSITVVNPYVVFEGKKVLINGRTAIRADEKTPDATEIYFNSSTDNMYLTGPGEVICRVAFAKKYVSHSELADRSGSVIWKTIVSLNKDGHIQEIGTGFAMGMLTCR